MSDETTRADELAEQVPSAPAETALEPAAPEAARSGIEAKHQRAFASDRWSRIAGGVWITLALLGTLAAGVFLSKPILGLLHGEKAEAPAAASAGADAKSGASGGDIVTGKQACEGKKIVWYQAPMDANYRSPKPGKSPMGMDLVPACHSGKAKKKQRQILTGKQACEGKKIVWYQAPMDANFKSPKPGKSPMGMDLVPACKGDKEVAAGGITVDSRVRQEMGITTSPVEKGELVKTIRAVGYVDYDERRLSIINTKIDGWVDHLYVDYTGKKVKRGAPLLALYSPELVSSQQDLLIAAQQYKQSQSPRDQILMKAAEQRFRYWDFSQRELEHIEKTGKVRRNLVLSAPRAGVVVEKKTFKGAHVKAGDELFRIADLSRVWVYVHVYEMDVPFVKVGQKVTITLSYDPGHTLEGKVDYIFPWVGDKSRDVKARLAFKNPNGALKPGMYVNADVQADLGKQALLVPDSAVIRTGTRNVVFVAGKDGTFMLRDVKLGVDLDDKVEVLDGVKEGDKVVTDGQFMLDSESSLKEASKKFEKPATAEKDETGGDQNGAAPASSAGDKSGSMKMPRGAKTHMPAKKH